MEASGLASADQLSRVVLRLQEHALRGACLQGFGTGPRWMGPQDMLWDLPRPLPARRRPAGRTPAPVRSKAGPRWRARSSREVCPTAAAAAVLLYQGPCELLTAPAPGGTAVTRPHL